MDFSGFYGNRSAKAALSAWIDEDRLPQAIIIQGDRGCGKRTLAARLAQACVCTAQPRSARPCGRCAACQKSMTGGHPDVMRVEGGDRPRSFGVELVRAVRADVNILPNEAARKVYILAQAHNMTEQAQNALLKILEEPPAYAVFILTAESALQLLPTVRSRAALVSLSGADEADAVRACAALCPRASDAELHAAAALWDGNIGRMAESLSEGMLPRAQALCDKVPDALLAPAETALLTLTAPLIADRALCRAVCGILRAQLAAALAGRNSPFGGRLAPAPLARCAEAAENALRAMDRFANQTLTVTRLCAQMRRAVGK